MIKKDSKDWANEIIELALDKTINLSVIQRDIKENAATNSYHLYYPNENRDPKINQLFTGLSTLLFRWLYIYPLEYNLIFSPKARYKEPKTPKAILFAINKELYRTQQFDKIINLHDFFEMNGYTIEKEPNFFAQPNITGVVEIDETGLLNFMNSRQAVNVNRDMIGLKLGVKTIEELAMTALQSGGKIILNNDGTIREIRGGMALEIQ